MTDDVLLALLWDRYKDTTFSQNAIGRDLSLNREDEQATIHQLHTLKDQPPQNGLKIKSVASGIFKVIRSAQNEGNSPKGLTDQNEAVTGEMGEDFPEQSRENAHNHADSTDDPLPAVPTELKARPQWLVWKNETRDGKPTKVPYQINGKRAQANQLNTWTDYQTAMSHRHDFSGIGFVFSENDPYCGIDLDNCLDDNGKVKAWAEPIIERLKPVAYGEVSPSSKGIKFWTQAVLPENAKHKAYIDTETGEAIEVYDRGRFFTVTGKGQGVLGGGSHAVNWLVQEYLKLEPSPQPRPPRAAPSSNLKSADEVISHIRESKQCHKFDALMAGNTTGYGSQSEADLALCSVVAFWTQDPTVIDTIFRQSKLYNRPKWDEPHRGDKATYGTMTIETALSGKTKTYTSPSRERDIYHRRQRRQTYRR